MMATIPIPTQSSSEHAASTDWRHVVRHIGPQFAARAAAHDANDSFVADNFADLKRHKIFSAGVPAELAGSDASHAKAAVLTG